MSLSYVVDGETDLDSALFNPIIDRVNGDAGPLANMRAGVANVLDYSGTSTEKIKSALADLSANGGGICSIVGDYELAETIVVPANVRIANGSYWSEATLTPAVTFSGSYLLSAYTSVIFEDLTLDLGMHGTCTYGIAINGNANVKYSAARRCNIKNAAGRGIWVWTGQGVWIEDNEIEDCVRGIHIDAATADGVWVTRNRVTNGEAGRMEYGIRGSDSVNNTQGALVIDQNYVEGADYATANGSQAIGIALFRSPGSIVTANMVTRCGNPANGLGAGILAGMNSEGSTISFNHVFDTDTTGIYLETDGVNTDIDTVSGMRGATANNNVVHGNAVAGMSISYAAGSRAIANHVYGNGTEGIVCDSDFCDISHNHVYNNWQDGTADAPAQNDGRKAGIRGHGNNCAYIGNHAFDNQGTATQTVAMAVENAANIIMGNQLRGTDALYESGAGTANTKSGNVEQDV